MLSIKGKKVMFLSSTVAVAAGLGDMNFRGRNVRKVL